MKTFNSNFAALLLGTVATVVTLSSCQDTEEVTNLVSGETPDTFTQVSVQVSPFDMSQSDFPATRAAVDPATYSDVGAMTLAFYEGTTKVFEATQLKADATTYDTFGSFNCRLPKGDYTMVVIARDVMDGDVFTLTSPTEAGYADRVRETFCKTQSVTVGSTNMSLSVTLTRVVARLGIKSTDTRPEGIGKIRITYAGGSRLFSPTTGLAFDDDGFSSSNEPKSAVGEKIGTANMAFLATDEQVMDVTIEILGTGDEILFTHVVKNVPLQRNRTTYLQGPLFSTSFAGAFTLETDWLPTKTVDF